MEVDLNLGMLPNQMYVINNSSHTHKPLPFFCPWTTPPPSIIMNLSDINGLNKTLSKNVESTESGLIIVVILFMSLGRQNVHTTEIKYDSCHHVVK